MIRPAFAASICGSTARASLGSGSTIEAKASRHSARWKALWWWSNHQVSRGELEYLKSTMARVSVSVTKACTW